MGALALPNDLSLVTIAGGAAAPWASLLQWPERGDAHVPLLARTRAERNLLGAKLDAAVTQADRAVLLLAQGAGCHAAAWWARLSPASYVSRVAGAILFQPMDAEADEAELSETFASPRIRLPFPSVVVGGGQGRGELLPQIRALAENWGSRVVVERDSPAQTAFRRTRRVIARFTAGVVERDVDAAARLLGQQRTAARLRLLGG
ncbi:MAG: alpha/beta hydrolase [Sphingomonas sp.]|uniref:alpha/beta hydrolase n=1 Tax=Sphingomonas sp. TaxID=28214 RepID=UPI001B0127BD|nr:alpha/beta hydrolase [Sphingomonas sp.]MBO9622303.1 alpha/beta hydrolase [Sphingomonas sp.]